MPSFSFVKGGLPVAFIFVPKVLRKQLKLLHLKKIYLHDHNNGFKDLTSDTYQIYPLFSHRDGEIQNHRIGIFGKSGSGKSTFVGELLDIMKHHKLGNPDKDIIVFSGVEQDEPIDRERNDEPPERVDIYDPEIYSDINDYCNSICVFDDVENLSDKNIDKAMQRLRNGMLERGRHKGIDIISISHDALSGNVTKKVHSESTGVVIFPAYSQVHQLQEYLTRYIGLAKKDISKITSLGDKSRWVYVSNTAPTYVIYKHGIYLVN